MAQYAIEHPKSIVKKTITPPVTAPDINIPSSLILPPYAFIIFAKYKLAINKLKKTATGSPPIKKPTSAKQTNTQNIIK